jgi:outer membrane protein insertion porin family
VVRRQLRTVPGDYFSRSNVQRSVRELATLSYFVPQNIKPNVINVDYGNKTADVIYELDESASTDNFELSGGFGGQGIGLILATRINFNNFSIQNIGNKEARGKTVPLPTGDGQRLSLGVQVTGQGYQMYDFQFSEPWFMGRPNSLGFGVSYSLFNRNNFKSELFNVNLSLGRRLTWPDDYFTQSTSIGFQKYDVQNDLFLNQGVANLFILRHNIERNSLDNFISPNRGSKFTLSGELAPPVGAFAQFWKAKFKYQHHQPVIGKLVISSVLEYGYMGWFPFGERSQFGRFRLGGTPLVQRQSFTVENVDLRGFPGGPFTSIAPTNDDGVSVGGTIYNKYAFELRIPAVQNESVQLIPYSFIDAGNSYLNFERWDAFRLKRSAGMGIRIFLPVLGLIDLSYGYRFDGIEGTSVGAGKWEFLFNIGPTF